jgi:hypothetical protein
MKIHLVSYATAKYRHRQVFLSASGRANGIVDSTTSWNPRLLDRSAFPGLAPNIRLSERGSGFWAWKPYIILEALDSVPDGDIVLYCDVGRKYPYILLEHKLHPYLEWMDAHSQTIMPGVMIPWNGPMKFWTKRDAFVAMEMDRPEIQAASPIQASFSLWRSGSGSRDFVREWLSWCVRRPLVSDDPSACGLPELPGFRGHRHDQSLMTLCCLKHGIHGIDPGPGEPCFNERDPGQVAGHLFSSSPSITTAGRLIRLMAAPVQATEQTLRKRITLGKKYE